MAGYAYCQRQRLSGIDGNIGAKTRLYGISGRIFPSVCRYNRRETEASLIVDESDKVIIPGNQNLSDAERKYRIENYHRPYYHAIMAKIESLRQQGVTPRIFSVHGFTPQLRGGSFRPWNAGILYVTPNAFAEKLLRGLRNLPELKVDANVPYDMRRYNTGAAAICGEDIGLENAVIEIRDSEFDYMAA